MSEDYKYQASWKFGLGQTGMLNVRAASAEEFKAQLDALSASDILGDLSGLSQTIKALDTVEQAGLQPTVVSTTTQAPPQQAPAQPAATPLQQYQQHPPPNEWNQQAAQPPQQPQAVAGPPLPVCIHGPKQVISKQKADGVRWYAYACQAQKADPSKCELTFPGFNGADMPMEHKGQAKWL